MEAVIPTMTRMRGAEALQVLRQVGLKDVDAFVRLEDHVSGRRLHIGIEVARPRNRRGTS